MKVVNVMISCMLMLACTRYNTISQSSHSVKEEVPMVHVKDWGYSAMSIGESVWADNKDSIVAQIGTAEFEKVKSFCGFKKVPSRMSIYDGKSRPSVNEFNERMSGLKVYKIAAYTLVTNQPNGKLFERYAILRCPYKGNESWDSNTKWDTVYFVVHEEAVKDAPLVHVKDWGYSAMDFLGNYWEDNKDSIVAQIGTAEFEKLKSFSGHKKVPARMTITYGERPSVKDFNERMKGLKVYKIGAFNLITHTAKGKLVEPMNILRCYYAGNENWDSNTKWDIVYFVVHEGAVEAVN